MFNKGFNLLPKKSNELILKEKKRDSYSIYYTFLVFFGVVLWLGLVVFNSFVVDRSTNDWKAVNKEKQDKINNEYAQTRKIHGELVVKTKSIAPLLEKDIDPETIFKVAEQAFSITEGDVAIVGYGRNKDGSFTISISASDSRNIAEKARGLRNLSMVKDLSVDKVSQSPVGNQLIADFNFLVDKSLL
jgi:hypothetical protein